MKLSKDLLEYIKGKDRKEVFSEVHQQATSIYNSVKNRPQVWTGSIYNTYFMMVLALVLQEEVATSKNLWRALRYYQQYLDDDIYFYIEKNLERILEECNKSGKSSTYSADGNAIDVLKHVFSRDDLLTALMAPCSGERDYYGHQQEIINALDVKSGESVAILKRPKQGRRTRNSRYPDDGLDIFVSDILLTYPEIKAIHFNYENMDEELEETEQISPELVAALRCMVLEVECSHYSSGAQLVQLKPDRLLSIGGDYEEFFQKELKDFEFEHKKWVVMSREIWNLIPELKSFILPSYLVDTAFFVTNKRLHSVIADAISLNSQHPYPTVAVLDIQPQEKVEFIVVNAVETTRKMVAHQRVIKNDYSLSVGLYTVEENIQDNRTVLCGKNGLAKFCRGISKMPLREKDFESEITTPYVTIALQNRYDSKAYVKEDFIKSLKKYETLENGDIVVARLGNPVFYIIDWLAEGETLLLTFNQFGLKVADKDKILPEYLCLYLNSSEGQAQLSTLQTGSTLRSLNERILSKISIKLLPMEQQERLAKEYRKLHQEKRRLIEAEKQFLTDIENTLKEAE